MEKLPPIPSPPSHHWREFRIRVLPALVFCTVLGCAVFLWRQHVSPLQIIGEVEKVDTVVVSLQPGVLHKVTVVPLQEVQAGEFLGEVATADPDMISFRTGLLRSEVELATIEMNPILTRQRSALDYQRLRMDYLSHKVGLATARVNLQRAQSELNRQQKLFEQKLIAEDAYEIFKAQRDSFKVEVEEKTKLIDEMGKRIDELTYLSELVAPGSTNDPMSMLLTVRSNRMQLVEQRLRPVKLRAPISGIVTIVHKREGENVVEGVPIFTITGNEGKRIVAYARQPLWVEPKIGMSVNIRVRGNAAIAQGKVVEVGSSIESVPFFSPRHAKPNVDRGLPFFVSVPAGMRIRPGELVDLAIVQN